MTMGSTPVSLPVALCSEKDIVRGEDGEEGPPGGASRERSVAAACRRPLPVEGVNTARTGWGRSQPWRRGQRAATAWGSAGRGAEPDGRLGRGDLVRKARPDLGQPQAAHPASIRSHQMVPPVALVRCAHEALVPRASRALSYREVRVQRVSTR